MSASLGTPTAWTDVAGAFDIMGDVINGFAVTVDVRTKTRYAGHTVQPRIIRCNLDSTHSFDAQVALGSAESETAAEGHWQRLTFTATGGTGKFYRLQILVSNAQGVGYALGIGMAVPPA